MNRRTGRGAKGHVQGELHHAAQLTDAKVRAMRHLHYVKGLKVQCCGRLYGVSYCTAWDAIKYNTWKHVQDTPAIVEATKII